MNPKLRIERHVLSYENYRICWLKPANFVRENNETNLSMTMLVESGRGREIGRDRDGDKYRQTGKESTLLYWVYYVYLLLP